MLLLFYKKENIKCPTIPHRSKNFHSCMSSVAMFNMILANVCDFRRFRPNVDVPV